MNIIINCAIKAFYDVYFCWLQCINLGCSFKVEPPGGDNDCHCLHPGFEEKEAQSAGKREQIFKFFSLVL